MESRIKKNIVELTRITVSNYRKEKKLPYSILLDSVRSLHNVGSVMRTADAFLVDEVILGGISGIPPHPELHKTALGAENSVNWRHADNALEEVRRLKSEGYEICVLEQTHGSIPLQQFIPREDKKYLIVAGNEVEGVDQRIVDISDNVIEIPQFGTKHSLNVSVSAGIAMWHFFSHFTSGFDIRR